jgi:predicted nucleic acid-binding Zn ribbon protein
MPNIADPPPAAVKADLQRLRAKLDATLPKKNKGKNLLLATWNLRGWRIPRLVGVCDPRLCGLESRHASVHAMDRVA